MPVIMGMYACMSVYEFKEVHVGYHTYTCVIMYLLTCVLAYE